MEGDQISFGKKNFFYYYKYIQRHACENDSLVFSFIVVYLKLNGVFWANCTIFKNKINWKKLQKRIQK